MDYEKAYKEALARARKVHKYSSDIAEIKQMEYIFSELAESEDDKIRNFISNELTCLRATTGKGSDRYEELTNAIAWLEKQGEQKPADRVESMEHSYITPNPEFFQWIYNRLVYVHNENPNMDYMLSLKERIEDMQKSTDKVEPKFKVGDWIINRTGATIMQVVNNEDFYESVEIGGQRRTDTYNYVEWDFRLWSIQDAKDGDVLASNHSIFIFSQEYIAGKPEAHGGIMNGLFIVKPEGCWTNEKCYPATKEQQDILYQKMNEEGYEWNNEKKELLEIEEELTDFEKSLKHIMIETLECGDTRNLKADAEMLLRLVQEPKEWSEEDESMYTRTLGVLGKCYMGQLPTKVEEELKWFKSLKQKIGG